jgi:hypothetical protein
MGEQIERVAANEATFRELNEQLEAMNRAVASRTWSNAFLVVCECADLTCVERFDVSVPVYEQVRSDPSLFLVVPGHVLPEIETVLERHDGFAVLRKRPGKPERIAEETDPRRPDRGAH